jgi:citrate synthase
MKETSAADLMDQATKWWSTAIVDAKPGVLRFRGYPIEQLIGGVSFPQMIWLMLQGELPSAEQGTLLEAALVSAVDHGPQAPSIAIGRMAVTCGLPLNGAMASAINVLDDIHGGAGEQCMEIYTAVAQRMDAGAALERAVAEVLDAFTKEHGKIIPGFGHRFHAIDPRSARLLSLLDAARERGVIAGRFADIGRAIERELHGRTGKKIPMNIDGATALLYAELGFAPALARGLFILSRSVGILAHAWEQSQQGGRIKGQMPPAIPYSYTGPARRDFVKS